MAMTLPIRRILAGPPIEEVDELIERLLRVNRERG